MKEFIFRMNSIAFSIEKLQTIKPENWIKEMSIQKLIAPHSIISYSIIFLILFKDFIPNNPINYNTLK